MSVPVVSRRPRLVVSLVAAGVLVASVFSAEPAANATSAGSGGHRTPAIGIRPHYTVAGRVTPGVVPTFSCQLTTPANCYGPAQIRAAYGVDQLSADGKGTTIAIVDAFQSPTIQHDVDTFDALFNLPSVNLEQIAPQGLTPFDSGNADMVGWAGEITLDVEWAHAIAPKATIRLVLLVLNGGKVDGAPLSADRLLVAGSLVLTTNVITFALLYWQLDSGGPAGRAVDPAPYPDFQFPQTATSGLAARGWQPRFHDYLYLAFTSALAFSPTDTLPLVGRAKGLMAMQSVISLSVLVVVLARVINILPG